jgi:hypothetical protein
MSLDISLTTEARLAAKAREQGLSIDSFLERLINDSSVLAAVTGSREALELPVWHLGARSNLRRRDIYDDVR